MLKIFRCDKVKLNNAITTNQLPDIEELYKSEFPKEERKPFPLMLEKEQNGEMEILAVNSEEGEFLGLVITIIDTEWILLDYFAIKPEMQGKNIGSDVICLLNERYKDKGIVIEIERTDTECENRSQRIRRKQFYLKNGMREAGILVTLYNVEMELLTNGKRINYKEYYQIYQNIFGEMVTDKIRVIMESE